MLFNFLMIAMLAVVFPFPSEASSEICPRWVKLNKSPVCFGAKGNQYGRFSYHRNIFVSSFMLVHRSGNVSCVKKPQQLLGMYSESSEPSHLLDRPEQQDTGPRSRLHLILLCSRVLRSKETSLRLC